MDQLLRTLQDRKRWTLLTVFVALVGLGWIAGSSLQAEATTDGLIPAPKEGFLAPDFQLETIDGSTVTLSDFQGRPVIINLWASWCPPCRAEMPALQSVYEEYSDRGLEILAVHMTSQDSVGSAQDFINQNGLTFPIPLDRRGFVGTLYQSRALPSTFFLDRSGMIQKVVIGGPMSEVLLRSTVESLLEEDA